MMKRASDAAESAGRSSDASAQPSIMIGYSETAIYWLPPEAGVNGNVLRDVSKSR